MIGDRIEIKGESTTAKTESYLGGFSYKDYLRQKRIYYIYYNPNVCKWVMSGPLYHCGII